MTNLLRLAACLFLIPFSSMVNAAFEPGKAILYAYDAYDGDTYFLDLQTTAVQAIDTEWVISGENQTASFEIFPSFDDSGFAMFLSSNPGAQYSIIGSIEGVTQNGYISSSLTGIQVGPSGLDILTQQTIMNNWIADIKTASNGDSSFSVAGTHPISANPSRNNSFFEHSLVSIDSAVLIYFSQTDPSASSPLTDPALVTMISSELYEGPFASVSVGADGRVSGIQCLSVDCGGTLQLKTVPLPAGIYLYLSGLVGLGLIKRRSK
jgi:hypothetical protein